MIESITLWHKRARENPTYDDFRVQLGCHLEEIVEMLDELGIDDVTVSHRLATAADALESVANGLKCKAFDVNVRDRGNFLKELCDGVVTAAGVAQCAGMSFHSAMEEVNRSNWSKFNEDGYPEFDKQGKVKKGERYSPANMRGMF